MWMSCSYFCCYMTFCHVSKTQLGRAQRALFQFVFPQRGLRAALNSCSGGVSTRQTCVAQLCTDKFNMDVKPRKIFEGYPC